MAKATDSPAQESLGGKRKLLPVPVVVILLLMVAEGVGVFFLANVLGPDPKSVIGAEMGDGEGEAKQDDSFAELEIAECRPSNKMAGKFINFHIRVSALVSSDDLEGAEALARGKRAQLEDCVNTVIRRSAPKHFNEPGYETLKRRLKQEIDRVFGDDQLIKKILIPHLLQSGPGV